MTREWRAALDWAWRYLVAALIALASFLAPWWHAVAHVLGLPCPY